MARKVLIAPEQQVGRCLRLEGTRTADPVVWQIHSRRISCAGSYLLSGWLISGRKQRRLHGAADVWQISVAGE